MLAGTIGATGVVGSVGNPPGKEPAAPRALCLHRSPAGEPIVRVNHIGNIHSLGNAGLGEVLQVLGKIVLCRFARRGNVNAVTYQA